MPKPAALAATASEDLCRFLSACFYEPTPLFTEERLFESMLQAARQLDAGLAAQVHVVPVPEATAVVVGGGGLVGADAVPVRGDVEVAGGAAAAVGDAVVDVELRRAPHQALLGVERLAVGRQLHHGVHQVHARFQKFASF